MRRYLENVLLASPSKLAWLRSMLANDNTACSIFVFAQR
uniref:Uncharacterized protein n=1 Tax=Anguilla anguilla TaxID=7936 RepID=A0A0E9XA68_ANGAN